MRGASTACVLHVFWMASWFNAATRENQRHNERISVTGVVLCKSPASRQSDFLQVLGGGELQHGLDYVEVPRDDVLKGTNDGVLSNGISYPAKEPLSYGPCGRNH